MYDREERPGNSRRKVRNKGGTTTRRPSLNLLDPLPMNFRVRVFHHHSPCRAAVRTCSAAMMELTYKAAQGASTGVYPAHCRDQRTRVTSGKWHGYTPPGLPSCRTGSAPSQDGAQAAVERLLDGHAIFVGHSAQPPTNPLNGGLDFTQPPRRNPAARVYLQASCFGPGPVLDHFFKFVTNFARLAVIFNRIGWYL